MTALAEVADPEIPAISIVDLGVVHAVAVEPARGDAPAHIAVRLLPTFVGCPALDVMRDAVVGRLARLDPCAELSVAFTYAVPWTSERITPAGREALRRSGFAPPLPGGAQLVQIVPHATCPYCGSSRPRLENAFGPTLCRTVYYCTDCRQPFEAFKTV